jgi:hypothetical protein
MRLKSSMFLFSYTCPIKVFALQQSAPIINKQNKLGLSGAKLSRLSCDWSTFISNKNNDNIE